MKTRFVSSFFESLNDIRIYHTWWYRTYETIFRDVPQFFKNIWIFRKEIYEFRDWQYSFNLALFKKSLEQTVKRLEKGYEEDRSRNKKIQAINRSIEILKNIIEDNYTELAEIKLGYEVVSNLDFEEIPERDEDGGKLYQLKPLDDETEKANKQIFDLSHKLEKEEWDELWNIFKGQDYTTFKKYDGENQDESYDLFINQFDGSGLKGWWD